MNENEEKQTVTPEKQQDPTIAELAKALKEQKENSVSKEQYEKLEEKNTELMRAIIDGSSLGAKSDAPEEKPADLRELAKSMTEGGIGNLEYAKRALKFREEYMKQTERDPFAPNNEKMTQEDLDKAAHVAEVMQDCIDQSDGSESVYNALLTERIKNDSPALTQALAKKGLLK